MVLAGSLILSGACVGVPGKGILPERDLSIVCAADGKTYNTPVSYTHLFSVVILSSSMRIIIFNMKATSFLFIISSESGFYNLENLHFLWNTSRIRVIKKQWSLLCWKIAIWFLKYVKFQEQRKRRHWRSKRVWSKSVWKRESEKSGSFPLESVWLGNIRRKLQRKRETKGT